MARSYLYWPDIDREVENLCKSCIYCLENRPLPPRTALTPWKAETGPWKRVHMDYLGPVNGRMFLLMIDAYCSWVEIYMVQGMTSAETLEKVKDACSRYGLPDKVVSDNGRQFVAENMQEFFKRNAIQHITTPVANPTSNGLAKNAVKTFKTNMKIRLRDSANRNKMLSMLVAGFLYSYRTTEHCTTGETPAQCDVGSRQKDSVQQYLQRC
ncbi:hypothetical protein NQ315_002620 [Exocentrus adspersus]|uniref:Integrase catalytic domain-containing protein n=1 Tax=Exocentrus adspersus TaxID=1586481 RepID=A0AAV8VUX2_9CUCU|nr:hypothetical protein NQ315_002620 [Exocentrus adspersus]